MKILFGCSDYNVSVRGIKATGIWNDFLFQVFLFLNDKSMDSCFRFLFDIVLDFIALSRFVFMTQYLWSKKIKSLILHTLLITKTNKNSL